MQSAWGRCFARVRISFLESRTFHLEARGYARVRFAREPRYLGCESFYQVQPAERGETLGTG